MFEAQPPVFSLKCIVIKMEHSLIINKATTNMWRPCLLEKTGFEIRPAFENQFNYDAVLWRIG